MRKRKRRKNRRQNKGHALFGTAPVMEHPVTQTVTKGGLMLLTAIAAGGVGAALGKHSLLAGIPVTLIGFHKKNPYIIATGLGLTLSNGFQNQNRAAVEGVDGFDIKVIAEEAKDRIGTFFKNFSEKLYIGKPAEPTATAGLSGDQQQEQVTYFVNPYNESKELDMSAIDRIQEQIATMNGSLNEVEREF